jgi:hypothetical protein
MRVLALTLALFLAAPIARAAPAKFCTERATCTETARFAAEMAEFRFSRASNSYRMVTATIRFTNKSDKPLTLAYVDGTGIAIDDAGNRYTVQSARTDVQGIGTVTRRQFDPTFTLAPGESSEARFTVRHFLKGVQGTVFDFDVAIREIDATPGGGHQLGRENLLRYSGLRDGMTAPRAAASPAAPSAGGLSGDACGGAANCKHSSHITATLVRLTPEAVKANNQGINVAVEFRNVSNAPLVLNYKVDSGYMVDEFGQRYSVDSRRKTDVSGIPVATPQRASSALTLTPGEARAASFRYTRFVGKTQVGRSFTPDLVVEQYELLPSNQLKLVREHAFSFPAQGGDGGAAGVPADLQRALQGLGELFKKP